MEKSKPITINTMKIRTLSEEFYSRSPGTQLLIKSMVLTTPTSKLKRDYTNMNIKVYNQSTKDEQRIMEQYGLVPGNMAQLNNPNPITNK